MWILFTLLAAGYSFIPANILEFFFFPRDTLKLLGNSLVLPGFPFKEQSSLLTRANFVPHLRQYTSEYSIQCPINHEVFCLMGKCGIPGSVWLLRIIPLLLSSVFIFFSPLASGSFFTHCANRYPAEDQRSPFLHISFLFGICLVNPNYLDLSWLPTSSLQLKETIKLWIPRFLCYRASSGHSEDSFCFPLSGIPVLHCLKSNVWKLWFHIFCPDLM